MLCAGYMPISSVVAISKSIDSAHPETVFLPDLCVMLKILSSEYQLYACGKIFCRPFRGVGPTGRRLDLEQKSSFLDGH